MVPSVWSDQINSPRSNAAYPEASRAEADYTAEKRLLQAERRFATMSGEVRRLTATLLPVYGAEEGYTLDRFVNFLATYKDYR